MSLMRLVHDTPTQKWNWDDLSQNPNMHNVDVLTHPNHPWNLLFLLANPSFSLEAIDHVASKVFQTRLEEVLDIPASIYLLSQNPSIPLDYLLQITRTKQSCTYNLAKHPQATLALLDGEYASLFDAQRIQLMGNSAIPIYSILEHIYEHPDDVSPILSTHKGIQYKHIQEFPDIRWHWPSLSCHHNMTPSIVQDHPDHEWYTPKFWTNPTFYLDDIMRHIPAYHYTFYSATYSNNPNVRFRDIDMFPELPWRWSSISRNPGITIGDVRANLNRPWDFSQLSTNTFTPWTFDYSSIPCMERMKYTLEIVEGIKDELVRTYDIRYLRQTYPRNMSITG